LNLNNKEETIVDLDEEEEKMVETTPRSKMGSNDVSTTPKELGYDQYVQHRHT
jgi:hypothetical protein